MGTIQFQPAVFVQRNVFCPTFGRNTPGLPVNLDSFQPSSKTTLPPSVRSQADQQVENIVDWIEAVTKKGGIDTVTRQDAEQLYQAATALFKVTQPYLPAVTATAVQATLNTIPPFSNAGQQESSPSQVAFGSIEKIKKLLTNPYLIPAICILVASASLFKTLSYQNEFNKVSRFIENNAVNVEKHFQNDPEGYANWVFSTILAGQADNNRIYIPDGLIQGIRKSSVMQDLGTYNRFVSALKDQGKDEPNRTIVRYIMEQLGIMPLPEFPSNSDDRPVYHL